MDILSFDAMDDAGYIKRKTRIKNGIKIKNLCNFRAGNYFLK
jgi:hypothetical protein